jgi:ABC-2 type transport system ATP-binding protein
MHPIELQHLTKRYGELHALRDVNLQIPKGAIFGFLGPNGAGKTTAIRILLGLLRATEGMGSILGMDCWRMATTIHQRVGYLPGDIRLYEWMRGRAFLQYCNAARGGGHDREIARLRERFELDMERKIGEYSRGMKQKLGLIQAMLHRPEILILDEPTTALDPLVQQTLYEELRLFAGEGRTVLFSSHTLSEVEQLCDRVAIIRAGSIIENNTIEALRGRALRRIEFRLKSGHLDSAKIPEGLTLQPGLNGLASARWRGGVEGLLPWLMQIGIEDLSISPPSLEDLFTEYYK